MGHKRKSFATLLDNFARGAQQRANRGRSTVFLERAFENGSIAHNTFSAFGNPPEPAGIEEDGGCIGASDQTFALELGEVAVHGLARQPDHFG